MSAIKSYTLVELLIVVIIVGILASISLNYATTRESAYDKNAIANLKLIRAAEIGYRADMGNYYASSDITFINQNLRLALPSGSDRKWNYQVWGDDSGCSRATRNGGDGRSWFMPINEADGEPNPGVGCP